MTSWEIREGDALERLADMPDESVQCCVTSPPYFGLRDYGTGEWDGGDPECGHLRQSLASRSSSGLEGTKITQGGTYAWGSECGKCGARRVDRQIGLERSPDEFVARLVDVFREVRRVLRSDGTLWLNIGDSFCSTAPGTRSPGQLGAGSGLGRREATQLANIRPATPPGMKPKDLMGIPWLLAFALRADGWYLRSDVIWAKPNPMPESVTDRPTSAHEHVFLLAKSARYFYDADAIREPLSPWSEKALEGNWHRKSNAKTDDSRQDAVTLNGAGRDYGAGINPAGRNKRNVWEVATQPYADAHFATFPPKLIEPCILAGSADGDVILDPFAGAGTTGLVALRHDRSFIGIELNPSYAEMARERIRQDAPLLNTPAEVAA